MASPEVAVSLGGSLIIPHEAEIRDLYVCSFAVLIKERVDATNQKTAIVTGGGRFTRLYQNALRRQEIYDSRILDKIGIGPTHTNAEFVAAIMNKQGVRTQYLESLHTQIDYTNNAWTTGGNEIGQDSDGGLIDLARRMGITKLINATNVPYVFERTPDNKPDRSRPIKDMTWSEYAELMKGEKQESGQSLPFGIEASHKASEHGLSVIVLDGNNLYNFKLAFEGKPCEGTYIHP